MESIVSADELMRTIDTKRARQRELTGMTWGAPKHIVEAAQPELATLHLEIDELKVKLYRLNGGKIDN
jgi:hypothetical protein